MSDETPEDRFQRWLAENPPTPRAPPKPSWLGRAVAFVGILASIVLWGGIAYAILGQFGEVPDDFAESLGGA